MADFKPITTQEELDKLIGSVRQEARKVATKEYEQQLAERNEQITGFEKQLADMNAALEKANQTAGKVPELEKQVKAYELRSVKARVAHEVGLPYELAARLSGAEEKDIRADAESLKKLMGNTVVQPLGNTEQNSGTPAGNGAWGKMLQSMKGE